MSQNRSSTFRTGLRVELAVSQTLRRTVACCYSFTLLVWLILPLSWLMKLPVAGFLIIYSGYLFFYRLSNKYPHCVKLLEYTSAKFWRLYRQDGSYEELTLRAPVFVTPKLVIARFGNGFWPARTVVIPADAVDAEALRHLRVRLLQSAYELLNKKTVSASNNAGLHQIK